MPFRNEGAFLLFVSLLIVFLVPALPARAERTQSDLVLIREGDVLDEDLYAAGNRIQIDGRIEGDLVASAFEEVHIGGEVTGSVTALTGKVVVEGRIGGSLRAIAAEVVVGGEVGGDVLAGGRRVQTEEGSTIGRDLIVWAWTVDVDGAIGRNLEGQQRHLALGGTVDGDVDVTVAGLTVADTARVAGDLSYRAEAVAAVAGDAEVGGSIIHKRPLPVNVRLRAIRLLTWVLAAIGAIALGLAVLWAVPVRVERAARAVRSRPLPALGWGLGLFLLPLVLAAVAGLVVGLSPPAAGVPLLFVLAPLVLAAFSLLFFGMLLAPVPVAVALGRMVLTGRTIFAAFVAGAVALLAASLLPYVGIVLISVFGLLGLGGWMLSTEGA